MEDRRVFVERDDCTLEEAEKSLVAEQIAPKFFEHVFRWASIAFLACGAIAMASLFCLYVVVVVRMIGDGAIGPVLVLGSLAALKLFVCLWLVRKIWTR
jgi:hypothetical protein